jgi:hypothetical protein
MRIVLVGAFDRAREGRSSAARRIVAEFATLASARASGIEADAIVIAGRARGGGRSSR